MNKLTILGLSVYLITFNLAFSSGGHEQVSTKDHSSMKIMNGKDMGMSTEMMQKRKALQAKIIQIQKEPDLHKRQILMRKHMINIQDMMTGMHMDGRQGIKIPTEMKQNRQEMFVQLIKITNEPDATKRQAMLADHMKIMDDIMRSKYQVKMQ